MGKERRREWKGEGTAADQKSLCDILVLFKQDAPFGDFMS